MPLSDIKSWTMYQLRMMTCREQDLSQTVMVGSLAEARALIASTKRKPALKTFEKKPV